MIKKIKNKLKSDIHFKELIKGSAITFILKITGILIAYFAMLIISKKYGAEGLGVFGIVFSSLNFLAIISAIGMNVSVLRFVGEYNSTNNKNKLFALFKKTNIIAFSISTVISIIIFFTSTYISILLDNDIYDILLKYVAFILPIFTLNIINVEYIRGLKKLIISEFLRSISRYIILLIVLFIPFLNLGEATPVVGLIAGITITFILGASYIVRKKKTKSSDAISITNRSLILTSFPMMLTALSSFIIANISLFFVEYFQTSEQVGYFSLSFRVSQSIIIILLVTNSISAPKFSELFWNNEFSKLQKYLNQTSKLLLIISFLSSLFLIIFPELILGVFGEEFKKASTILRIMTVGQFINASTGAVSVFMNMTGNQILNRNINLFSAIVMITLSYLLTKHYGLIGAAIATSSVIIMNNLFSVFVLWYKTGFLTIYFGNRN